MRAVGSNSDGMHGAPAASGIITVVTGADHPTGLGSGRALTRAGARVIGVTRSPSAAPCRSRVWRPLHPLGEESVGWIEGLADLGATLEQPAFLLPTQDHVVADLSRQRAELTEFYRFVLPPDDVVQTFLDKTRFYEWARHFDLPLPASRIVHSEAELRAALHDMPLPVILKPLYRTPAWNRMSPVEKAMRFDAASELDRIRFDLFAAAPALIVSHWIEGPDSSVHYCLAYCERPGEIRASFTGRKLLQYPRQTGSTAICVGTENGEVREIAEETFRHSRFEGIGSVEVKYGADGRPYITEPTVGRPNLQSYSAVAAGCNLHALAMAHALGLEWHSPKRGRRNCWWIEEGAVLELVTSRSGQSVPWSLLGREALRARRIAGAYWVWWDPAPAASLIAHKARRWFRRVLSRDAA
jgi:D-aspartate ligase